MKSETIDTFTNEDFRKLQANLIKLGKEVRTNLESKIKVETKTIMINGVEHTVEVKVCPPTHGTGLGGQDLNGREMFGDKFASRSRFNPERSKNRQPRIRNDNQRVINNLADFVS